MSITLSGTGCLAGSVVCGYLTLVYSIKLIFTYQLRPSGYVLCSHLDQSIVVITTKIYTWAGNFLSK